jgi:hypothetical protein
MILEETDHWTALSREQSPSVARSRTLQFSGGWAD